MAAAAIPLVMTGLSALTGLFSNRSSTAKTTQQQDTTSKSNSTQNVDLSNTPQYTPEMAAYRDQILAALRNRFTSSTDLSGYQTTGLQNINQGADMRRKAMENILASRGLSASPSSAGAMGRIESGRIGEQVNFLNQIPLLQRQLQGEDLSAFGDFFSRLPVGNRQTGTTTLNSTGEQHMTGSGTQTNPGNMLGGLFGGLGAGLAAAYGDRVGSQQPGTITNFTSPNFGAPAGLPGQNANFQNWANGYMNP